MTVQTQAITPVLRIRLVTQAYNSYMVLLVSAIAVILIPFATYFILFKDMQMSGLAIETVSEYSLSFPRKKIALQLALIFYARAIYIFSHQIGITLIQTDADYLYLLITVSALLLVILAATLYEPIMNAHNTIGVASVIGLILIKFAIVLPIGTSLTIQIVSAIIALFETVTYLYLLYKSHFRLTGHHEVVSVVSLALWASMLVILNWNTLWI